MQDILSYIPKATEIESAILGLSLQDKQACALMLSHLTSEDFAAGRNQKVFNAIHHLFTNDAPVNPASVRSWFQERGDLDSVGGLSVTDELADAASGVNPDGVDVACEYLKQFTKARKFIALCEDYRERAMQYGGESHKLFAQAGSDFFNLLTDMDEDTEARLGEVLDDEIESLSQPVEGGITTGLDVDKITKGFKPGQLVTIAGKTSHGKSALAYHILLEASKQTPCAVVSMEMTRSEIIERLLSNHTGVSYSAIEEHKLTDRHMKQIREKSKSLSEKDMTIIARGTVTADQLYATARRLKLQHDIGLLVVDYLQLIDSSGERREREVANASRMLKRIAMDLDMVVIDLSQFSRAASSSGQLRPQLHQLKESGAIEQDSNTVIILWNPSADGLSEFPEANGEGDWAGQSTENVIELHVAKNRGGKTGTVKVGFDGDHQRFYNLVLDKKTAMDYLR